MRYFLTACLTLICFGLFIPYTDSYEKPLSVQEKIPLIAEAYKVSYNTMYCIVSKETAGTFDPKIQSGVRYAFSDPKRGIVKGEQEMSYGLAQIHLPDHPTITLEQATDADFALHFLADNLAKGKGGMWTTYKDCK